MRNAETVLGVLRERGRRHWPLERVYRLLFNRELYLLAYGRIYSNKGAMTPGVTGETADGMSMEKIERIIDALRHERYRFSPVRPGPPGADPEEERETAPARPASGGGIVPLLPGSLRVLFLSRIRFIR